MCGIAGVVHFDSDMGVQRAELERMATAMVHRGPDSDGFHLLGSVGFAFRRLSIIDVKGGDQPISNEDGSVTVVFNGEIYNHESLRRELEAKGHKFKTHADTECIVHGYEEWGARGVCERLRGMFAFAIHDASRGRVVLGRDRMGIKPLHFRRTDSGVLFASELKSLLAADDSIRDVSPQALIDFVTLGYVPAPGSIFSAIEKLPPAHFLVIENGRLRQERYWDVSFEVDPVTLEDAAERVRELLHEAVGIRLMSEVPLGCFLSGGLDSSAVVAAMVRAAGTSVQAVTVGFEESAYDERASAARVADHLGIQPAVEVVHPDPAVLDRVHDAFDEPHADPSDVPTFLLCLAARRRVTVALSGDGGDELFAGYRRYAFDVLENRVRSLMPNAVRRAVLRPLGSALPKGDRLPRPLRAKTLIENLAREPLEAYLQSVSRVTPQEVEKLIHGDVLAAADGYRTIDLFRSIDERRGLDDPVLRIRAIDLETWLPDDILTKVDRASMAHSLEVRVPILDHHMVEFATTLPRKLLLSGTRGKLTFKAAMRGVFPDDIIDRTKQGFDLPVQSWMFGPLAQEVNGLAEDGSPLEDWFDLGRVRTLLDEHQAGRRNRATELWSLLSFARWRRRWLDH